MSKEARDYIITLELTVTATGPQEAIRYFMDDCADTSLDLTFIVNGRETLRRTASS